MFLQYCHCFINHLSPITCFHLCHQYLFNFTFHPLAEAAFSASTGTMQCWGSDRYGGSTTPEGPRFIDESMNLPWKIRSGSTKKRDVHGEYIRKYSIYWMRRRSSRCYIWRVFLICKCLLNGFDSDRICHSALQRLFPWQLFPVVFDLLEVVHVSASLARPWTSRARQRPAVRCPRNRVGLLDKTPCNEYEKEDTRRNFPHETIKNIKEQYQKCTKEDIAEYSKHSLPQADRNSTQSGCIMLHPQIIAGKSAFVALNKNAGTITCWGLASQGGNSAGGPWWGCLFRGALQRSSPFLYHADMLVFHLSHNK